MNEIDLMRIAKAFQVGDAERLDQIRADIEDYGYVSYNLYHHNPIDREEARRERRDIYMDMLKRLIEASRIIEEPTCPKI